MSDYSGPVGYMPASDVRQLNLIADGHYPDTMTPEDFELITQMNAYLESCC